MNPVMTNTTDGLITVPAASDLSASIGCFANIGTDGNAALPSANGLALYTIEDAYSTGGAITPPSGTLSGQAYVAVLRPLVPNRNFRVPAATSFATPGVKVTTNSSGKAVPASSGGNILAITEESAVVGQNVLIRPLGGIQTL